MLIRKRKKLWALFLSAALIVTQLPAVAENTAPEDGSIASFEALDSGVAYQNADLGTELSGLNLPDTVKAAVYHVTGDTNIPDGDNTGDGNSGTSAAVSDDADESVSGNSSGDSSAKDSRETVTTVTTSTEEISVTWDSEPAYDGNTAASYVFTADAGGYPLSDGVKPPQITVTVLADSVENPTENPTEQPSAKPLPCTLTEGCILADGHEGECVTEQPTADAPLMKTVTGWTFVGSENLDRGGLALPGVGMDNQADFDTVVSMLPTQISVEIDGVNGGEADRESGPGREAEDAETLDIAGWSCGEYKQDTDGNWPLTGEYTFTAALPEGYACDPLPAVKVLPGGGNLYANDEYDGLTITGGAVIQETNGQIRLTDDNGNYTITGTWAGELKDLQSPNRKAVIKVPDGVTANVKMIDVTIDVSESLACAFAVETGGRANITLSGTNILSSGYDRAGLEIPENAAVTIGGSGRLTATGGGGSAGIGGSGSDVNCGIITINGGTVQANGEAGGAGIGGGGSGDVGGSGGIITINGGTVTANGSSTSIGRMGGGGAGIGGGYGGSGGGTIAISGGTVTATGGSLAGSNLGSGAGIGGGRGADGSGSGETITISGGTVIATGGDGGAGIGGGSSGNGGNITISGGIVNAYGGTSSSEYGAGIGGGYNGTAGDITVNGNTVVFAKGGGTGVNAIGGGENSSDMTAPTLTQGVVFEGSTGTIYGSSELPGNITIPDGFTLTVPDGSTLTVPDGTTLDSKGTITNEGTINSYGTITGNQPSNGTMNNASATTVTFAVKENGGYGDDTTTAVFGDTVKITVTAQRKTATTQYRSAAKDKVDFYIGSNKLGTADTAINGGTATAALELTLSGDDWDKGFVIGENRIVADFGGAANLLDSIGTAELTVNKRSQTAPSAPGLDSRTDTSITILSVLGQRYLCTADQAKPTQGTGNWMAGTGAALTFSGLKQGSMYYLWTYIPGNEYTEDSDISLSLTVTTLISGVEVLVTAPVAGNAPADSATVPTEAGYEVSAVTWEPSDSGFQFGEAYKVTVALKPKADYAFAPIDKVSGKLNGHNAAITAGATAGTFIVSYQFNKLPDAVIAMQMQPANITVTEEKISGSLDVAASVSTGGSVSYAWYSCDDMMKTNPQSTGVTTASFSIPTDLQQGDYYYFCRISATGASDLDSSVAVVTVKKESSAPGGNGGGSSSGGGSSNTVPKPQSSYKVTGDNISSSVSRSDLKKLADSGKSLALGCDKAGMTFDSAALKAILAAVPSTAGNITFAAAPADPGAFPDAAEQIGAHPVYNFTISYKDGKGNPVTVPVNFPAGSAAITLNYVPAAAEVTGSLFMVYVDGKGAVTWLDKSSYDNGRVLAEVTHFSTYGVAYKTPAPVFTDISGHWAKQDIEFVAARGLLSGTGNKLFSPDGAMTRGMFVTALGRLAGVNPDSYQSRSFTDIKADVYYAAYGVGGAEEHRGGNRR